MTRWVARWVGFALLLGGCFPTVPDGVVACGNAADCPDDTWSCVAGRCTRGGGTDAGPGLDAGPDGGAPFDAGPRMDAGPQPDGGRDAGQGDGGPPVDGGPATCGPSDLLFYASFDGDSLADACGATPTPVNGPSFAGGQVGRALHLTPGARVTYASALTVPDAFSIALWFLEASPGDRCPFGFFEPGLGEPSSFFACTGFTSAPASGPVLFMPMNTTMCTESIGSDAAATTTAGVWHHLAITTDGTNTQIYVDGIVRTSGSRAGAPCGTNLGVVLGAEDEDPAGIFWPFEGDLDEVKVFGRALSPEEVCADARGVWGDSTCNL